MTIQEIEKKFKDQYPEFKYSKILVESDIENEGLYHIFAGFRKFVAMCGDNIIFGEVV